MKTSTLGTLFGALALVGVGVLYVKVDRLSDEVRPLTWGGRAEAKRVEIVEAPLPSGSADVSSYREGRGGAAKGIEEGADRAPRPAGTIEERVARLERAEKKRDRTSEAVLPRDRFVRSALRGSPFARSVDDLSQRLELTPTQKDRVHAAIDHGKRRIEEIMKIPDEEGKSPHERQEERREKIREAVESGDTSNLMSIAIGGRNFWGKSIPGRNSTYGDEIDRVKKETRDEIAQALTPEQKKEFEEVRIDPMLGGGGGFHTFAVGVGGPGGEGGTGVAEVIIEEEVHTEEIEEDE